MADMKIPVFSGLFKSLRDMMNGTHAEIVASASIVTDSTGQFTFDKASLPSVCTRNAAGQIVTVTIGPDAAGRSIRRTTTWDANGEWASDSAWVLV